MLSWPLNSNKPASIGCSAFSLSIKLSVSISKVETSMPSTPSDLTEHNLADPCAHIQAQLAAYALGEVDADIDILTHLSLCSGCQEDLRAYVQVAWMLAHEAPAAAPPPELRARILAAATAQATAPAMDAPPAAAPEMPQRARQPLPPAAPAPRRRGLFVRWPAFAFATLALLALVGWNLLLQSQLSAQVGQVAQDRAGWQAMIVLLNDPTVQRYQMVGTNANGHFWAAPQSAVACLVIQGLPKLDGDHSYQVWLIHGQEHTNGGVFDSFNGNAWILIRNDKPMSNYDTVDVTIETRDGSAAPTSAPVLRGALSAKSSASAPQPLPALVQTARRRD
jgi:anti-sigma-K factor RskA